MKTLDVLLKEIPADLWVSSSLEAGATPVGRVTSDSRKGGLGTVFVALRGSTSASKDGHDFLAQVERDGALALVGEIPRPDFLQPGTIYVQVTDSAKALGLLASAFWGHPSRNLKVLGVTGTSGKTTTSYILESIFLAAGDRVGVIGTVNTRWGRKVFPATHTTPGAAELQELLAQMREEGVQTVVMEVSSHALKQKRTYGIAFDGAIFTNLSEEHLDYHPDMLDYFRAKEILFTEYAELAAKWGKRFTKIVSSDDSWTTQISGAVQFGWAANAKYSGQKLEPSLTGVKGRVGGISIESSLVGRFNAMNLLGAVALAAETGVGGKAISEGIAGLKQVPGRMQQVANARGISILVDYAHKPDALEKVLQALDEVRGENRILTVFGCGGDRDRSKRPKMGAIAARLSQEVWVTSDNPRTEDPLAIVGEILNGVGKASHVHTEPDRKKAIHAAIAAAQPGDVVLIAGKGHENYQIIGTRQLPFDDVRVAQEAVEG